ncbi:MAG: ATP phosphoribosyltransferase regulatory subunit, partial [Alphaproteobacteria bacterium]|nr:ATP phosphoribosyltransferase regulatory subunit [Alphaproteobacteria bacterium]
REAGLALQDAIEAFDQRTGFMAARGIAVEEIRFSAAFGRNLDYYTGVVFEVRAHESAEKAVIGGGRYDGLLRALGAAEAIPAVGCAIFVDRLNGGAA